MPKTWRCVGSVFVEGTYAEAEYDFELESLWGDEEPTAQEVFEYMVSTGIIQIIPESIEEIED